MNALLHVCCGTCGNAMHYTYAPQAVAGKQQLAKWQECTTMGCPNKGKRQQPSFIELKEYQSKAMTVEYGSHRG